jgi:hypothetical protein
MMGNLSLVCGNHLKMYIYICIYIYIYMKKSLPCIAGIQLLQVNYTSIKLGPKSPCQRTVDAGRRQDVARHGQHQCTEFM